MEKILTWLSKQINPIQWLKWLCSEIVYLLGHRDIIKVKDENLEATRQFSQDVILHRDELRTQLVETKKERDSFKNTVKFLESKINDRDAVMIKVASAIDHQTNELHKITKKVDRFLLYKMFIRLFTIRFGVSGVNA